MSGLAEKWAQKVLEIGLFAALFAIGLGFALQLAKVSAPAVILKTGFWILLATPSLRVVTLMVAFFRQKEKKFAWVAGGVILILVVSSLIGKL